MTVPLPPTEVCPSIGKDGSFAWGAIGSDEVLETCVAHVAKALESPQKMADWLAAQGFAVTPPYDSGALPAAAILSATWPNGKNPAGRPYGDALSRAGDRFFDLMRSIPGLGGSYVFRQRDYRLTLTYAADGTVTADAGTLYL